MNRKLLVTVDCGKTTCGDCTLNSWTPTWCQVFHELRKPDRRCPACLRAEAEARKEGKR